MDNCYSVDHIAEDHIHTDITCNSGEPQQKYRLGTVSKLLGGGGGALVVGARILVGCAFVIYFCAQGPLYLIWYTKVTLLNFVIYKSGRGEGRAI